MEREARYYKKDDKAMKNAAEQVSAHPVTLVEISEEFKQRIIQGYGNNPRWVKIIRMVEDNAELHENVITLLYKLIRGLMYFDDPEQGKRLCIP